MISRFSSAVLLRWASCPMFPHLILLVIVHFCVGIQLRVTAMHSSTEIWNKNYSDLNKEMTKRRQNFRMVWKWKRKVVSCASKLLKSWTFVKKVGNWVTKFEKALRCEKRTFFKTFKKTTISCSKMHYQPQVEKALGSCRKGVTCIIW